MGKKEVLSEDVIHEVVLPTQNDVLCIATRLLGFDRIMVKCQDGNERLCRIRGKTRDASGYEKVTSYWFRPGIFKQALGATSYVVTRGVKPTC